MRNIGEKRKKERRDGVYLAVSVVVLSLAAGFRMTESAPLACARVCGRGTGRATGEADSVADAGTGSTQPEWREGSQAQETGMGGGMGDYGGTEAQEEATGGDGRRRRAECNS